MQVLKDANLTAFKTTTDYSPLPRWGWESASLGRMSGWSSTPERPWLRSLASSIILHGTICFFPGKEKAPRAGGGRWAWDPALVLWRKAFRYCLSSWQAVWETSMFLSRRQADIRRHRSALWLCHPMYHQRRPVWRHPGLKDQTQQLHRMRKARLDWSSPWSRISDLIFFSKCGLQLWLN